jgi:2',3'-cyclic-nucleotide 2'-phosphodiesterase (5'-nucleotidase family)
VVGDSLVSVGEDIISFADLKGENIILKNLIDKYNNNKEFSKVIGYAASPLKGADELGSLMADALIQQLHADIAFQNKGGIRLQSIDEGDITLKELFQLDPFNNEVMLYSMNTEEIRSLILYGYNLMKGIDLQVAGIRYTVLTNAKGEPLDVELLDSAGRRLDEKKEYLVAVNNYVANAYKFNHRDPGTLSNMTTAEALKRFLGISGKIDYSGVRRATVIRK